MRSNSFMYDHVCIIEMHQSERWYLCYAIQILSVYCTSFMALMAASSASKVCTEQHEVGAIAEPGRIACRTAASWPSANPEAMSDTSWGCQSVEVGGVTCKEASCLSHTKESSKNHRKAAIIHFLIQVFLTPSGSFRKGQEEYPLIDFICVDISSEAALPALSCAARNVQCQPGIMP